VGPLFADEESGFSRWYGSSLRTKNASSRTGQVIPEQFEPATIERWRSTAGGPSVAPSQCVPSETAGRCRVGNCRWGWFGTQVPCGMVSGSPGRNGLPQKSRRAGG